MLHRNASDRAIAVPGRDDPGAGRRGPGSRTGRGRGRSRPEESARKIKPAEGLEATLWASEPMLSNPTNIDVDSRGRVWVTEGLNYRLTRGGNRRFHRIEEADRIKILEDTDGDGKADKVTVFADRIFPVPMGIAVEEHYDKDGKYRGCNVFVGNSPDLLVLEDTDGDDKADKRYPLLTGFGGVDSDHGVHGMVAGPRRQAVLHPRRRLLLGPARPLRATAELRRRRQGRPARLVRPARQHPAGQPRRHRVRDHRDRQRNNYETCLNSFGNIFTSDNDDDGNRGCRVIWVMDGGHYGYHTPGSPRHWGEEVPATSPSSSAPATAAPAA